MPFGLILMEKPCWTGQDDIQPGSKPATGFHGRSGPKNGLQDDHCKQAMDWPYRFGARMALCSFRKRPASQPGKESFHASQDYYLNVRNTGQAPITYQLSVNIRVDASVPLAIAPTAAPAGVPGSDPNTPLTHLRRAHRQKPDLPLRRRPDDSGYQWSSDQR
jgi:hypothetical protein